MVDQLTETPEEVEGNEPGVTPPAVEEAEVPTNLFRSVYEQFWVQAQPRQRNVILGVLGAAVLVLGGLIYTSVTATQWQTLVRGMEPEDQQAAVMALQAKAIPHKLDSMGTILVPEEQIHTARLEVAASTMPSGRTVGFELFDTTEMGRSTFAEKVNYHRALEGEISRTIKAMAAVTHARVHLVLPERRLFVKDEVTPTASVQLTMKAGVALTRRQVDAVRQLVASGVERLEPNNVSVVDQKGVLLAGPEAQGWDNEETMNALNVQTKLQSNIEGRVVRLLEPVFGEGHVKAQVAVELDFSRLLETEELYDPESQVIRSEREKNELTEASVGVAQGAPGTPTNVPDRQQAAAANMPVNQPTKTDRLDHIKNYEIDKRTRRLESPHARIKRLSVGVVVHDMVDSDGNSTMTDAALERYRSLVAKAVGIDLQRGDEVEVIAMPFYGVSAEAPVVAPPLYTNPYFIGAALFGLFAMLLGILIFTRARRRQRELQAALLEAQQPDILADFEGEMVDETLAVDEEQIQMETRIVKLRESAIALSEEDLSTISQVIERWLEAGGDLDAEEEAA